MSIKEIKINVKIVVVLKHILVNTVQKKSPACRTFKFYFSKSELQNLAVLFGGSKKVKAKKIKRIRFVQIHFNSI